MLIRSSTARSLLFQKMTLRTSSMATRLSSTHLHSPAPVSSSASPCPAALAVPKVCRAAPVINFGSFDYKLVLREDYPVPEPGHGELLVEVKATGVCQSDHHFVSGDWGNKEVHGVDCMGHEGAGVVAKVGPGVDPSTWKIGDRVGVLPIWSTCGECEYCTGGHESLCRDTVLTAVHCNGTFLQYTLTKADYTCRIPDNVPFEQAAPFMCSGGTAYASLKSAGLKPGQKVVIMGAGGGVGHMVVQFARAQGLVPIGVDMGAEKGGTILECGAEHYIDASSTPDLQAAVASLTGGLGAHGVIVCAGSSKAYSIAPKLLRPLGVVVAVGLAPKGSAFLGAEPSDICFGALNFRGILVSTRQDMEDALTYLAAGKVKEHINKLPFSAFPQALEDVAASRTSGRSVIVFDL